ncbi:MAG: TIGR04255 family protein [Ktedonobacteraceae bacterium]
MGKLDELLPTYDQILFNNSALVLCLTQLKFPPVQRFSDESYMVGIKEALAEEYPLVNPEQGVNIVITPQGVNQTPGASMLRFTSIDSRWSVVLSGESVSLETREYTSINEFAVRFTSVLRCVHTHFKPRHQLRFGLRYINEFRHSKGDSYNAWTDLLNPALLGLGASGVLGGRVEQTIGEVLTRRDDGNLLVRHGFLKGSTVAPTATHPAKTGPFYLLDLDYYDETPVKFEIETPVERMIHYNDILYRVFRWSIGNGELFQQLRG